MTSPLKKLALIFTIILIAEMIIFWDYIGIIHWGQIKVSGLSCTCPDESVINGKQYLRFITPDSLKKYDIDYSEIYVSERPSTDFDPMGVDNYIIYGKVIGKERVSEYDPWNLKIEIERWREVDLLIDWGLKFLYFLQIIIFGIIIKKKATLHTFYKKEQRVQW